MILLRNTCVRSIAATQYIKLKRSHDDCYLIITHQCCYINFVDWIRACHCNHHEARFHGDHVCLETLLTRLHIMRLVQQALPAVFQLGRELLTERVKGVLTDAPVTGEHAFDEAVIKGLEVMMVGKG